MVVWREGEQLAFSNKRSSVITMFCIKPPAAGQKRQRESWETMWYWGMFGGMGLAAVLLYYKPDTRYAVLAVSRFVCSFLLSFLKYTNLGLEGGQGENGSAGRKCRIQAVIRRISYPAIICSPSRNLFISACRRFNLSELSQGPLLKLVINVRVSVLV